MKTKREYIDYIDDIYDSIMKIESFVKGQQFNDFQQDEKTQYAVIRALEVIGEASKKIPIEIRNQYNELPWKAMMGMRDKLVHDYFGVDVEVVWNTVESDLKLIKPLLEKIIRTK